jgi:predicted nucleic acid-binding protein
MSDDAPIVSNAGSLMVLAKLNLLHLLKQLYGRVYVARSVYDETVVEGMRQGYEDAGTLFLFLSQMDWHPKEIDAAEIPASIRQMHLDRGERDTLALAAAMGSSLVLIDEAEGRQAARDWGLRTRGSLGILVEAYCRNLLEAEQLRLAFAEIIRRQDIWINPALVKRLLQEVLGE